MVAKLRLHLAIPTGIVPSLHEVLTNGSTITNASPIEPRDLARMNTVWQHHGLLVAPRFLNPDVTEHFSRLPAVDEEVGSR